MGAAAAAAAVSAAVVVTAAITYAVCGSPVVRAVTAAAATAAGAQVPPASDGAAFPYHRLLRAALCHIGKKYFRLTQFVVDSCFLFSPVLTCRSSLFVDHNAVVFPRRLFEFG